MLLNPKIIVFIQYDRTIAIFMVVMKLFYYFIKPYFLSLQIPEEWQFATKMDLKYSP